MAETGNDESTPQAEPTEEEPTRGGLWSRRRALTTLRNIIGGVVVAPTLVGQTVAEAFGQTGPIEFAVDGGDARRFFTTIPEKIETPLATKEAAFHPSGDRGERLFGSGDSLSRGYVEDDLTEAGWAEIYHISEGGLSTLSLFIAQAERIAPFAKDEGQAFRWPLDRDSGRWSSTNDSKIGATSDEVIRQIEEKIQIYYRGQRNMDYMREQGDPPEALADAAAKGGYSSDWTWDISMGGNDLIEGLFAEHIPEIVSARLLPDRLGLDYHSFVNLKQAFEEYLPRFQESYTRVLHRMLSEAAKQDSPLRNLKRIFVWGLPDGFEIDHIDLSQSSNSMAKKTGSRRLTPAEQHVVAVMNAHMNNAIVTAIEDAVRSVREKHPSVQMPDVFFEPLDEIDINGIHPSMRGYIQLAIRRLQRCYADFLPVTDESGRVILEAGRRSFWEQAQKTGKTIPLLQGI